MAYTAEQRALLSRFEELMKECGGQAAACRKIGVTDVIMSQLRKGTYKGDNNKYFEILRSYFDVKAAAAETYEAVAAESYTEIEYAATSVSCRVYDVIRNCQIKGGLAIACGDAGIGKTKAAKKFVEDHPYDSVYIALNPCLTSLKSLLKILGGRLGVTERTIDELWLGIVGKLRDGMVIIFDEAQHLPIKSIESLRAMSDYFADQGQTLGIAFVGNQETVRRIGGAAQKAEFAQIANRTKQKVICSAREIQQKDIELLFPLLRGKEKEQAFLLSIAQSAQAIRGAANLFSNAYDNENITYAGLVAMAKAMNMAL